jgi:hypothetical protein
VRNPRRSLAFHGGFVSLVGFPVGSPPMPADGFFAQMCIPLFLLENKESAVKKH